MTIRVIYTKEPDFPATDQHPDAKRYQIGIYWVDAIGSEPTVDDIKNILSPPPLSSQQKIDALLNAHNISIDELKAALKG